MDRFDIVSKGWSVSVTFRGRTKVYEVKRFDTLTEIQAKNIAFLMFVEDLKGELAQECTFRLIPTDYNRS